MYADDSFFTLTFGGRIGLAAISIGLTIFVLWLNRRLGKNRKWPVRLAIALVLFVGFLWLAPQAYYTYYVFLLDGLEWKNIIQMLPAPLELLRILTFQERSNLSYHGQGLLGWLLIGTALLPRLPLGRRSKSV